MKNCLLNRTGGEVQSMRWDPTGERLAVSFVGSNLIAIFQVSFVLHIHIGDPFFYQPRSGMVM